jgi:hypothetical protein
MGDLSRIRVTGPLVPYVSGFVAELVERGYTPVSAAHQLRLMAHVSRWLASEGLEPDDLSPAQVDEFVAVRRAAGYVNYVTPRALVALLEHLRELGVVPPAGELPLSEVEELLGSYRVWLCSERGLASVTARNYADMVRPFVASRLNAAGELDLRTLAAGDVLAFVLARVGEADGHGAALAAGLPPRGRCDRAAARTGRSLSRRLAARGAPSWPGSRAGDRVA